jgi:dTDP-4-dehydrorhamnose reductase
MKILVTGASGQLGQVFKNNITKSDFDFYFANENELDITNKDEVLNYITNNQINFILNCAAYTDVDGSELNKELALKVNSFGVKNLVEVCEEKKIKMIHFSTDYVYNSKSINPIIEDSNIDPINFYGFSKREGEKFIENSLSESIVIRTSWLYSNYENNFVKTMIDKGKNGDELYIVNDQFGCPTYAKDLVNVILGMLNSKFKPKNKIYNYSNEGFTNWYDFAKKIFELKRINCQIMPVDSENYKTIAKRPKYSVTDKSRIKDIFNISVRNWEDALKEFIFNYK